MKSTTAMKPRSPRTIVIPPSFKFNDANVINDERNEISSSLPFEVISQFFGSSAKRNAVTMRIEMKGQEVSDMELNSKFIELSNSNPNIRGINKQKWDIFLTSDNIPQYNPIADFLDGVSKDAGTGHIDILVASLELQISKELERQEKNLTVKVVQTLMTKWLVGLVASVFDNNHNPLMLVLIGPKGCGKTEFFRRLLPPALFRYFGESKFEAGKDDAALMCESLLILNDELDGLNARDAKSFRSFISKSYFDYRPPYGKSNIKRKRLATVCGTSNEPNIINDPDNNRRIIPIEILKVNTDAYNAVSKSDLLGEAYNLYKSGYQWDLNGEEMRQLDDLAEPHAVLSMETELIQHYFRKSDISNECFPGTTMKMKLERKEYSASQIYQFICSRQTGLTSAIKLGRVLRSLGFKFRQTRIDGKSAQLYECFLIQPNPIL